MAKTFVLLEPTVRVMYKLTEMISVFMELTYCKTKLKIKHEIRKSAV